MSDVITMPPANTTGAVKTAPTSTVGQIREKKYSIGIFDGKERSIVFDLNAFAQMEEMYGDMEKAQEVLEKGRMKDVRTMLWLGLIHDEAVLDQVTGEPISYNVTPYQVGGWITTTNMKMIVQQLQNAINGAMPEPEIGNTPQEDINTNAVGAAGNVPNP